MSVEQKVRLASEARGEFRLTEALSVLSLARSTYCYHRSVKRGYEEKYRHLRRPLEAIARAHPEYGYRRSTVELCEGRGEAINRKVVQKLHRLWDLPLLRRVRAPRPSGIRQVILEAGERANLVGSLERIGPFEVAYTDF